VKLYQAIAVIFLLALGSNASAQTVLIDLHNNTVADLCVEGQSKGSCQEILAKRSREVHIRSIQWIQFGKKAFRYNFPRIFLKPGLRLQAEPDGKLYLLPDDAPLPASVLPKQPTGFPLTPTRRVDLT
jgi:hypothetical protein